MKTQRPDLPADAYVLFTWGFNHLWLLGPYQGYYWQWSDPAYEGGDNTIKPWEGNPRNYVMKGHGGRDKGAHVIAKYCGSSVQIFNV